MQTRRRIRSAVAAAALAAIAVGTIGASAYAGSDDRKVVPASEPGPAHPGDQIERAPAPGGTQPGTTFEIVVP